MERCLLVLALSDRGVMLRDRIWITVGVFGWMALAILPARSLWAQQTNPPPQASPQQTGPDAVQASAAVLKDPAVSDDQRLDAARKLVAGHSNESRAAILDIFKSRTLAPQIALAGALADNPDPDPDFIDPLFAMMTSAQDRPDKAAQALGSYKNNPQLVSRLMDFASNPRNGGQRIWAIKALGYMVDKMAAERLKELLSREDEDSGVRGAAAEALGDMTGLHFDKDFQRWQDWWTTQQGKSPDQFRFDLVMAKAAQLDRALSSLADVQYHYRTFLYSEYRATPQPGQADRLHSYLAAVNDPVMRRAGAEIVLFEKAEARPVPDTALLQLRQMVGDSDPDVRHAVVDALKAMNDRDALDPLLKQLDQEMDSTVRAAIAGAFGPIGDLKAVGSLLKLLDDPTTPVAAAAAESLSDLAAALHTANPGLAIEAARQLKATLNKTGSASTQTLRESVLDAMAKLKDPSLADSFLDVLNRKSESIHAHRSALEGLGNIRGSNADAVIAVIVPYLGDGDASVRRAAVKALNNVGAYAYANKLVAMCKPKADDPQVQNEAWEAIESFLPQLNEAQVAGFADNFKVWGDWDKRLKCLQQVADDFQKEKKDDDWANTQEDIAECQMNLKTPDYPGAAASYAAAMDVIGRNHRADDSVMTRLILARMKAMLRVGKIPEAIEFARQSIQDDKGKKGEIGRLINEEAERLRSEGGQNPAQLDNALTLIDSAMKLDFPEQYKGMLSQTKSDIQQIQAKNKGSGGILYPSNGGATARAN